MKKIGMMMLLMVLFLTGCSVEIDMSTSKSEGFASMAEDLSHVFIHAKKSLEPLGKNKELSTKEQEQIVTRIDSLIEEIEAFRDEDAPFLAKLPKKMALKALNNKEKVLLRIKEKAEKQEAEPTDVQELIETISDDYEINIFKK